MRALMLTPHSADVIDLQNAGNPIQWSQDGHTTLRFDLKYGPAPQTIGGDDWAIYALNGMSLDEIGNRLKAWGQENPKFNMVSIMKVEP